LVKLRVRPAINTVQLLYRETLNFITPELWPQQPELKPTGYKIHEVTQQRDYGSRLNNFEEIKQHGARGWKLAKQQYSI